ncbi:MAG: hypothetical protein ABFQ65_02590 [Nanoarchaeota archaeon]
MTDFLFHKVGEKEKQEIKKQAKKIIDDFSKKLEKISKKTSGYLIEREKNQREEKTQNCGKDFRKIMFENAPNKNEDFIIAEKKRW